MLERLSFVLFLKISRGAAQRPALCWWFHCMRWFQRPDRRELHKSDPTKSCQMVLALTVLWPPPPRTQQHNTTLSWQPSAGANPPPAPFKKGTLPALWHSGVEMPFAAVYTIVWLAGHMMTHIRSKTAARVNWPYIFNANKATWQILRHFLTVYPQFSHLQLRQVLKPTLRPIQMAC